ncbi:MAG: cyclase family protein [Actinomycetota bacterium]|nr:cyclase family protein [Actinomycetota bacterium]
MCLPGTQEIVRDRVEREGLPVVTRRSALVGGGSAALASLLVSPAGVVSAATRRRRMKDLTHVFRAGFPVYAFEPPSKRTLVTVEDDGFYAQEWTFGEHSGTHMDAPGHFIADGRLTPQIRPRELMFVPVAVIDISAKAAQNPDAVVTVRDLKRFERRHGKIPNRAAVFIYSGWDKKVDDPAAFKNADANGTYHFPGFSSEAATWLLEHRRITAIGVDTLSLDPGNSTTFDVHYIILGADRYGLENVANLDSIPPLGTKAFVGVVPWEEGSGGPARVIAVW